ncbi:MAG TPA: adenylate/guanylate cyclase domain-containing protein, partial [Herpetosiphonaceae bacterium]
PPGDQAEDDAERWLDYAWIPAPIQSELAVPITSRNEILGVLVLASDQPAAFDQQAETMLSALAAQVSVTLENAQLFAREQAHVSQLNRINSLSVKLTAELDVSAILDEVLAEIATIFDSERSALLVFDAADQRTLLAAMVPEPPSATPELPPPVALIAAIPQRRPLMTAAGAATQVAFSKLLQALKLPGAIIAPLPLSDSIGGLLVVERAPEQPLLRAGDRNLVQTVANLLAQSLANGRLYRAVADERRTLAAVLSSTTDPLLATGAQGELLLFNRAAAQALGLSDEQIGQPLTDPAILAMLGDAGELAGEHRLADGRIVRPSAAPVGSGGAGSVAQVVVLQDITSIKLLEQQRMQRLRDDMLRYMSPPVVEQLLDAEDFGEATERDVVVLFADLRGFTALSEGLAPRIVVEQVLNRFFATMTEVLYQHEGTIDKFMGDGIMAVFGSPRSRDDDALRAVEAAIAMQQVFPQLRASWQRELGRDVGLGVGVSFGRAVVGNLGSPQRLDYTLVGDVVNTASRLVNLAQAGQIIVAEQLVNQLNGGSPHEFRKLPPVELKGKAERIDIFEVVYAASETAA